MAKQIYQLYHISRPPEKIKINSFVSLFYLVAHQNILLKPSKQPRDFREQLFISAVELT